MSCFIPRKLTQAPTYHKSKVAMEANIVLSDMNLVLVCDYLNKIYK